MQRRGIDVSAVYDIECAEWDQFVMGGFFDGHKYVHVDWRNEDELVDRILEVDGWVWAHNGSRYDSKWFLDRCIARKGRGAIRPTLAGGSIVKLEVGRTVIACSKALFKMSLRELTAGLDTAKTGTGLTCQCEERTVVNPDGCGGYCAISRTLTQRELRALACYLKVDTIGLWDGIHRLVEFAAEYDLDLGATIGGAAWRNAQRALGLPDADLSSGDHRAARLGYHGGRVIAARRHSPSGYECDVNSAYSGALDKTPLPVGGATRTTRVKEAGRLYRQGAPGIYDAVVTSPPAHLPVLPWKAADRTWYPVGTFRGSWPLIELQYAEQCGYRIDPVAALTWSESRVIFSPWVQRLFKLRREVPGGKSGPMGTFLKYYLNSLTGKLGSRPDHDAVLIDPEWVDVCDCKGACNGSCGAFRPLGASRRAWAKMVWRLDGCSHVQWAAYLTAAQRIEWHRQATAYPCGIDVVYGDTDSLFTETRRDRNIGTALGTWEQKGPYLDLVVRAPKVYTYERPLVPGVALEESGTHVKAKGVRLPRDTRAAREAVHSGAPLAKRGIVGARAGFGDLRFFKASAVVRQLGEQHGDRIPTCDGRTRPLHVDEILARGT